MYSSVAQRKRAGPITQSLERQIKLCDGLKSETDYVNVTVRFDADSTSENRCGLCIPTGGTGETPALIGATYRRRVKRRPWLAETGVAGPLGESGQDRTPLVSSSGEGAMALRGVLRYIAVFVGSVFLVSLLAMLHRVHDTEKVSKKSGKASLGGGTGTLRQITKEERKLENQEHLYLGDSDDSFAVQSAFNASDFGEDQDETLMTNQKASVYDGDPFDEAVTSEGVLVTKIPKQPPWALNMTEVAMAKKGLRKYFNVVKRISLTKKDVQPGTIMHFDQSPENYVFSISPMLYDLLPERSPLQGMHHRKCAVIGNSGILLDSGCGNEINKADFVFRCNFAPTKGYEKDVGTKTNFTTFNGSILQYRFKYLATEKQREEFLKFVQALGDAIFWMPVFTYHTNAIPVRILTDFFWENRNKTDVKLAWLGNALKWINGWVIYIVQDFATVPQRPLAMMF
ncbi:ST8SIA3 [Branchiostoma lanceolatum]|uniref:ST8SIA3 protein n=1 Tax=Branchiostoma lanceolatum TaxID=7740 RepID=A0A8J9ZCD8_BRALA|nr:ST8SIA3 [Branchiostoma lanceolatum]